MKIKSDNKMEKNKSNFFDCHHGGIHSVKNSNLVKIDFSSNINPLGISKKVIKSLNKKYQFIIYLSRSKLHRIKKRYFKIFRL